MNSWVPFEGNVGGFFIVLGGMLGILVAMVVYFRRRGWL
jgi:Mg2+ and Co2+ transporter CorA